MRMADYYRHRLDLFVNGEVRFASGEETVEFVSIYVKESYSKYLSNELFMATTIAEEYDIFDRQESETRLVATYVKDFLYTQLPDTETFAYKVMRRFKSAPVYIFDTHTNSQLYENVLKRLGRTNDVTVAEAFPSLTLAARVVDGFTIEWDSILRIQ